MIGDGRDWANTNGGGDVDKGEESEADKISPLPFVILEISLSDLSYNFS